MGARTKPWVVIVRTPYGAKPYVVKLFDTGLIEYKDSVTNEVVSNALAPEFELLVPNAALIDFDINFKNSIRDFDLLDLLETKDSRLKFGTELLHDVSAFNISALNSSDAREMANIDIIYAFDNLIRNPDRNNQPENLLLHKGHAYLIDHELAFDFPPNNRDIKLDIYNWENKFWEFHIFHKYLKVSWPKFKLEYFSEFEEYLKRLNVNKLEAYFTQLLQEGFKNVNHDLIRIYLNNMKKKSINFVTLLKQTIA